MSELFYTTLFVTVLIDDGVVNNSGMNYESGGFGGFFRLKGIKK
jgi:hypothetical protein